jgi:hypothetical protein
MGGGEPFPAAHLPNAQRHHRQKGRRLRTGPLPLRSPVQVERIKARGRTGFAGVRRQSNFDANLIQRDRIAGYR